MIIMKTIFLHGLGQTAAVWTPTIQVMTNQSECLCPNLPDWLDHNASTYQTLYCALEKYGATFDEPFHLCGLSLGGILALHYAIEHPGKVHSLALIGTQYTMPKHLLQLQNLIFRLLPASKFEEMGFQKSAFLSLCKSMMDLDFEENLYKINCPVLLLCGERDKANKPASLQLKEKISNAELIVIHHAGHEINVDAPAKLGHTLDHFFNSVSRIK